MELRECGLCRGFWEMVGQKGGEKKRFTSERVEVVVLDSSASDRRAQLSSAQLSSAQLSSAQLSSAQLIHDQN